MTAIVWHEIGTRDIQSGLSHGVLFPPSGAAVPWNGLVSIEQSDDPSVQDLWFDGMKLGDFVDPSQFKGSLSAITYPDKLDSLTGLVDVHTGVAYDHQKPIPFGLTWRTEISDDTDPNAGYKIHILWNVIAVPKSNKWNTLSADPEFTPFEWDISATPDEFLNIQDELEIFRDPDYFSSFRPSAHLVIDSRDTDEAVLADISAMLYGTDTTDPSLPDGTEFYDFISNWALLRITNNLDGTFDATTSEHADPELISITYIEEDDEYEIVGANIEVVDADSYDISSTVTEADITP